MLSPAPGEEPNGDGREKKVGDEGEECGQVGDLAPGKADAACASPRR
jgi:hypothetical protein